MEDLLGQMDRTVRELRRSETELRPTKGPRIPHSEDLWVPTWKPPPAKEDVKALVSGGNYTKTFVRFVKNAGSEFHASPGYLKPNVLSVITASRVNVPDRTFAKLPSTIYFHAQSEPISEPTDDMCGEAHRKWLDKHYKQRDHHIHEVYHALEHVDRMKRRVESHARKREFTTDLLTKGGAEGTHTSDKTKSAFQKMQHAVKSARVFRSSTTIDPLAEAERKDKAKYELAKSAPCLRLSEPVPDYYVRHIRPWKDAERPLRCLQTSTPWLTADESRELNALGRSKPSLWRS